MPIAGLADGLPGFGPRNVRGSSDGDGFGPAGGNPGKLQRHADGLGSPGAQQAFVQIPRGDIGQLSGQIDGHPGGVPAGAKRKGIELGLYGGYDLRDGETDLMDVVSVKIHIPASMEILNIKTL